MHSVDKQQPLRFDDFLGDIAAVARAQRLDLNNLAAGVARLSEAYRREDFALHAPWALAAKLGFWLPRDVIKFYAAFYELACIRELTLATPLRVLDLGAGLGAGHRGLMFLLAACGLSGVVEVTAIDSNEQALSTLRALHVQRPAEGAVRAELTTRVASIEQPVHGTFDVVILGQVLCEWTSDTAARTAMVGRLLDKNVAKNGVVAIVEPALRVRARALMELRQSCIDAGWSVQAPCLHAGPCPLLTRPTDWCHEDWDHDLPNALRDVAKKAGLRWQGVTFAYLIVSQSGPVLRDSMRPTREQAIEIPLMRLVSSPLKTKGKTEWFVCGEALPHTRISRLDRDASGANSDLDRLTRGDWFCIDPASDSASWQQKGRVTKNVSVQRVFPLKTLCNEDDGR
jgi:SAM-dependent methyltransferase